MKVSTENMFEDYGGLQTILTAPSIISPFLSDPSLQRHSRRLYRFNPYTQPELPLHRSHLPAATTILRLKKKRCPSPLFRPQLNLPTKERSPSPAVSGVHISRLHPEILAHIFKYLNVRDKGVVAQVCSSWREASYRKSVWKGAEAKLHLRRPTSSLINSLTRRGIKRVQILSLKRSFREIVQGIGNLTSLNLSGCFKVRDDNLSQAFAQPIPTLQHLDLSVCKQITDKSIGHIVQSLTNLESLELGGCSNITDAGLTTIANTLRRLRSLNLRSCWCVSDEGIRYLAGQSEKSVGNASLERLVLQDCQHLSDEALKFISQGMTRVTSINLSFCINISDAGLRHLAKMSSLRELNLNSCDSITDTGLSFMAEAASPVTSLDVSFCDKVTDQALDYISQGLFNLKCLSVRACHVSDEGICKMAKGLNDLEVLNVGQCTNITESSLYAITESFKNLKRVDLYGCDILASVIEEMNAKMSPKCVFKSMLCDAKKS